MSLDLHPFNVALGIGALSVAFALVKSLLSSKKHFPPGPPRLPILGNALQIPQVQTWLKLSEWAKEYGDIVYLDVVGKPMIVLNSAKAAIDLLDKRSSLYSDRPHLVMTTLSGYTQSFPLLPYGDVWRAQRKLVAQDFSQNAIPRYHHIQESEARRLIRSVLANPSSLERQVKWRISNIIFRVTYGYNIQSEDDKFLTKALEGMDNLSKASAPGVWIVDFIPQLRHLPRWMPGSGFLATAEKWRGIMMHGSLDPYWWCKANFKSGSTLTPNLCTTALEQSNGNPSPEEESILSWAAASVMGGGMDTNMSTILTFFLAMVLHPDIQAKARAEIDSVVDHDRLPTIADKQDLPYVRSVIAEVFRWQPAGPLGLPHSLGQDDIYNGLFLPKGSMIVANVWHMLHDPSVYLDPMSFNPDRFQNKDAEMKKVTDLAFGFGRRACPGVHFTEGTIFAVVSTVLATCEILPDVDEDGKDVVPSVEYTSGTIVFPKPFKCRLKSRSPQALEMLSQVSPLE